MKGTLAIVVSLVLLLSCGNDRPGTGAIERSEEFNYDRGQRYTIYAGCVENAYADSISVGCGVVEAFSGNKMRIIACENVEITDRAGQYKKY